MSDRGPQFTSCVWKVFMEHLGVMVCLPPGTILKLLGRWNAAPTQLQWAVHLHKAQADRHRSEAPVFSPGDRVWLSSRNQRLLLPCRKLSPRFVGLFKVPRRVNELTYHLQLPADYCFNPAFHVSLLRPVAPGPLAETGHSDAPPAPLDIERGPAYSVREVLDLRSLAGRLQYLIDWERYGPEERCWVPGVDILDASLTRDFHLRRPDRPAPYLCGRPQGRCRPGAGAAHRGVVSRIPLVLLLIPCTSSGGLCHRISRRH